MALKSKGLTYFRKHIDRVIDRATFRTAGYVRDLGQDLAPVDEGDLESSGRRDPDEPNGEAEYLVIFGGIEGPNKFVDYAEFVEEDQPFLGPALDAVDLKGEIETAIKGLAAVSKA